MYLIKIDTSKLLFFALFLVLLLTLFINTPHSLRDLSISMVSSIFPFQSINVVVPNPKTISWKATSFPDALVSSCKNTFYPMLYKRFPLKVIQFLVMVQEGYPEIPSNWTGVIKCYIESFCTDIMSKGKKITILLQFLAKH